MTATPLATLLPLAAEESPLHHVVDRPLFGGHLTSSTLITNHMFMLALTAGLMLLIFPRITRRYRSGELVPTGTRNFFEALMIYVRDDVARPVLAEHTDRYVPYLWTLFFFILFNNLIGLLPLETITSVGGWHGIGGSATGNIYVTAALALVSFVVTQVSGVRANGLANYLKHFTAGAPWYMWLILIPVEIMGMFIKPFALAIRLFANMVAGHVLLAVLIGFVGLAYAKLGAGAAVGIGIVSVLGAVAIMCLEVFVAFLQAYLFTFLTALFIGQLIVHEHVDDHEAHEHDHHGKDDMSLRAGDMVDHSIPDAAKQAGTHMAG
ncbi:MAG: atpB [Phycisphaerales bacterium]|nr:atpB [Phycisphaerales bacterium]